jgi:hypothetical protein
MFSFNKTVVCIEFSKTSVFCALAQIAGRKVDIIAIDSIQIENGILEEGIIYDAPHLQHIIKNLITSVSRTHNQIDSAWITIPDNKVLITKFEVEKDKKGVREEDIHKSIEEKFNYSASKLYLINRPVHELNKKVFFLSNAIRVDNLEPFIELFEPLNIPVECIMPTFQCLFEESKEQFSQPTLVLYPNTKGFKFFLADTNGVYLESVWGHNVIEFNENFDKAINEVIQYAKQSKEVALGVKKIIVVDTGEFDSDEIQSYLQKTGVDWGWINTNQTDNDFNPVSVMILKGLIKACMAKTFSKGFLEPQMTHLESGNNNYVAAKANPVTTMPLAVAAEQEEAPTNMKSYKTVNSRNNSIEEEYEEEGKTNYKVFLGSIILGLALLGLMFYVGAKIANRATSDSTNPVASNSNITPTSTVVETTIVPTATVTPSAKVPTATPTPAVVELAKKDVKVLVLNGNSVAGEASKITNILKNNGYTTKTPGNAQTKNIQTTTVTYKDKGAQKIAEEAAKLIEPSYPSSKAVFDSTITEDILVVLGTK